MDSNARKQINLIREALKRQKQNAKERCVICMESTSTEASNGNKSGVYISRELLIFLINKYNSKYFKVKSIESEDVLIIEIR